jgi:hypothetical protein
MKEEFILFDTAKLAKEKGFNLVIQKFFLHKGVKDVDLKKHPTPKLNSADNELRYSNWNNKASRTSAPTQSLLKKWLRKKHKICVSSDLWDYLGKEKLPTWQYNIIKIDADSDYIKSHKPKKGTSYEEALEKGLQEALKLIKR